jgi:23S rRNA (pseudouridine1915-N3)-methyltransferase
VEVRLLAAGSRLPEWVNLGYRQYASRLTRELNLQLTEIPVASRRGGDVAAWRRAEGERMLGAIVPADWVVALDVEGKTPSTQMLSKWIEAWFGNGRRVVLTVGGPDGLDPRVRERADQRWSLSPLTLPHGLVRVVVAEALYRAMSLRQGHPYHRA